MDSKSSNDKFFNNIQEENGIKYYFVGPGATFYRADNPTSNNVVFNTRQDNLDERTFDSPPSSPVKTSNTLPIFPYLFFSPSYDSVQANYGKTIFEIQNKENLKLIALDQDQQQLFELLKDEKPDLNDNEIANNIMNDKKIDSNKSIKKLLEQHFAYNPDGTKNKNKCRNSVLEVDKFMAIYFSNGKFKDFDGYGSNFMECFNEKDDHFHSEFTIKYTRKKIDVIGIVDEILRATSVKKQEYKPPPPSSRKKRNIPPSTLFSPPSSKKGIRSRPSIFNLDDDFGNLDINTPTPRKKRLTLTSPAISNTLSFESPTSPLVSPVHGGKKKKTHKSKRKTKKSRKSNRKTKRKNRKK